MIKRDLDARPYSADELRVIEWLRTHDDAGDSDDPIGFILSSLLSATEQVERRRVLEKTTNTWRGGAKSAQFSAAALREWLDTKLREWTELEDLPDGWDWNDLPLFRIAIRELERLGVYNVMDGSTTPWRDLASDPPTGDRCVVLFPIISDVGIMFAASNPDYARRTALGQGYTHWMEIPALGSLEIEAEARCQCVRDAP